MMLKTRQIIDSVKSLNHILALELPAKTGFELSRLVNNLQPTIKSYNSIYSEKIKQYGTPVLDKDGKETDEYQFTKENRLKFDTEIDEVLETSVEVEVPKINIKDFDGKSVIPMFLINLDWLIKS